MKEEWLIIGGPMDGQTISLKSEADRVYCDDNFVYIKRDFPISKGRNKKRYHFLVPIDWDIFDMIDHIVKRYGNVIPNIPKFQV